MKYKAISLSRYSDKIEYDTINTDIELAFNRIMESSIFRMNGEEIDLCEALIELCNAIDENDGETHWNLGECLDCDLASLLVGAYWSLAEWHGGQASDEYATLCAIGDIYAPNYASGPEDGSDEETAYELVNGYFEKKYNGKYS